MDIQEHVNKLINNQSGVDGWLEYITELKNNHTDPTLLMQVYTYAHNSLREEPSVGYKKIIIGLANLQSGYSVEKARELYQDAKDVDIDCAVVRVYHAQFEYKHQDKIKAMGILANAKKAGCQPRSLLVKAAKNCKNSKASLFYGIPDPWDKALIDETGGDTQTNTFPAAAIEAATQGSDGKPVNNTVQKQVDLRPKLYGGPVRSVKKNNITSSICVTPRANGIVKRNILADSDSAVKINSQRRVPTMSPFTRVKYSPLVKRNRDINMTDSALFSNMFAPSSERSRGFEVSIAQKTPLATSKSHGNSSGEKDEAYCSGSSNSSSSSAFLSKDALRRMLMSPCRYSPISRSIDSIRSSTKSTSSLKNRSDTKSEDGGKPQSVTECGSILEDRSKEMTSEMDVKSLKECKSDSKDNYKGTYKNSCSDINLEDNQLINKSSAVDTKLSIDRSLTANIGSIKRSSNGSVTNTCKENSLTNPCHESSLTSTSSENSVTNTGSDLLRVDSTNTGSDLLRVDNKTKLNSTTPVNCTMKDGQKSEINSKVTKCRKNRNTNTGSLIKDLSLKINFDINLDPKKSGNDELDAGRNAIRKSNKSIVSKSDAAIADVNKASTNIELSNPNKENANPNKEPDKIYRVKNVSYKKIKEIGTGGSCKVLEVLSEDGRTFALKKVNLSDDCDTILSMYKNEITFLEKMKGNKHIIKLHDWEFVDKNLFLVLEKGDHDLSYILKKKKNLSKEEMKKYWREMVEAVNTIHENGIVHADLKPANFILVGSMLKLIDFGIANGIQDNKTSATRMCQMGTLNYMAPEVLDQDSCRISKSTDIWSLGCILYNMIYKKTPYSHIKNQYSRSMALQSGADIDFQGIDDILLKKCLQGCLKYKKEERYTIQHLLKHPYLS